MSMVGASPAHLSLLSQEIEVFCRKWRIVRLELFGSVLRDDYRDGSDVDFLVTFASDAKWSLLDLVRAQEELSSLVGRRVDLVERQSVECSSNWIRRKEILSTARLFYVA